MKNFKEILLKKTNVSFIIFFALGLVTTIQFLSFGGITAFNLILILSIIVGTIFLEGNLEIDKYFTVSFIATTLTTMCASINTNLSGGFRRSAIVGGIIYLCALVLYIIMKTEIKFAEFFLNGFEISCKITLVWCVLQLLFYYLLHIDLNAFVFDNLLGITGASGDYNNGVLIPSGFYSHRAILIPSLLFLFFSTSNILVLILIALIAILTKSTALIIGLAVAAIFKLLCNRKKENLSRKKVIFLLIVIVLFAAIILMRNSDFNELVSYVFTRITDATTNKAGNSSVVHFLYYKNFRNVLEKMNLSELLFGTGLGTSGQHYTWFNGQYSSLESWVVESDYINIFLGQGFVGIILHLYLLFNIVMLSKKNHDWKNIAFIIVIMLVGIMYNVQFYWFILVEFSIFALLQKGKKIFKM